MFKEATKAKLRFMTAKGELSTEQLWDLSVQDLDKLAVALQDEYNGSGKKSFLDKTAGKDKTLKLKFDVVLEILQSKVADAEAARTAKEDKEHNERIFDIIASKEDEALKGKSIAQLKKELR